MDDISKRRQIDDAMLGSVMTAISGNLLMRLKQKGRGISVSTHEILGLATEEMRELEDAVRGDNAEQVYTELVDLAVVCAVGMASICTGIDS